jgi:hypothetical protein
MTPEQQRMASDIEGSLRRELRRYVVFGSRVWPVLWAVFAVQGWKKRHVSRADSSVRAPTTRARKPAQVKAHLNHPHVHMTEPGTLVDDALKDTLDRRRDPVPGSRALVLAGAAC